MRKKPAYLSLIKLGKTGVVSMREKKRKCDCSNHYTQYTSEIDFLLDLWKKN